MDEFDLITETIIAPGAHAMIEQDRASGLFRGNVRMGDRTYGSGLWLPSIRAAFRDAKNYYINCIKVKI